MPCPAEVLRASGLLEGDPQPEHEVCSRQVIRHLIQHCLVQNQIFPPVQAAPDGELWDWDWDWDWELRGARAEAGRLTAARL